MHNKNEIAILDFGSQYTHLIARRIRELGVISHIHQNNASPEDLKNAVGIILSGGPQSVHAEDKLSYNPAIFDLDIPILGLCYGHQLIAHHFGGQVVSGEASEYGLAQLQINHTNCPIFKNVKPKTNVWMSHGDHVEKLAKDFISVAATNSDKNTAVTNAEKNIYGFQFHPEVFHSEDGMQMLNNFVFDICQAEKNWSSDKMLGLIQEEIKEAAGNKSVFLLISGGVDSTVAFALLEKTLGKDRVYGFHVDHGFMRMDESRLVKESLTQIGLDDLHIYNAEEEFLAKLEGISEPEEKRKIIGGLFIDIANRAMEEKECNENDWLLGQGTIYPDTIESGATKNADKIKTHHNRVDRIQDMIAKGLIIEPIRELYKDEVREIGLKLGLPEELIHRHPFPGPGLAIRCLCSDRSSEKVNKKQFNNLTIYQLPIQSVGVQGDNRTYAHPGVLLGGKRDWSELAKISPEITNKNPDLNRVLITVSGDEEKIETSALHKAYLTKTRLGALRLLDQKINDIVNSHVDTKHVWQMPIVLIPFGHNHGESIILRPVESKEAMTVNFAPLPDEVIESIKTEIESLNLVDYIFYDITNKPPGTIEWE